MRKSNQVKIGLRQPTYKELVIHYLEDKDFILYHLTGLRLMSKRDYNEAQKWTEEQCESFLNNIDLNCDANICPWCYFHLYELDSCDECKYGKRHGYCLEEFNRGKILYHNIIKILNNSHFVLKDEICELVEEVRDSYWKIFNRKNRVHRGEDGVI